MAFNALPPPSVVTTRGVGYVLGVVCMRHCFHGGTTAIPGLGRYLIG